VKSLATGTVMVALLWHSMHCDETFGCGGFLEAPGLVQEDDSIGEGQCGHRIFLGSCEPIRNQNCGLAENLGNGESRELFM